jgi:hypothetical protein
MHKSYAEEVEAKVTELYRNKYSSQLMFEDQGEERAVQNKEKEAELEKDILEETRKLRVQHISQSSTSSTSNRSSSNNRSGSTSGTTTSRNNGTNSNSSSGTVKAGYYRISR